MDRLVSIEVSLSLLRIIAKERKFNQRDNMQGWSSLQCHEFNAWRSGWSTPGRAPGSRRLWTRPDRVVSVRCYENGLLHSARAEYITELAEVDTGADGGGRLGCRR